MERELGDLRRHAAEVLRIIAEGSATLHSGDGDRWQVVAMARFDMLRALDHYVECKNQLLEPLTIARDPQVKARARIMRDRNYDMRGAYDRFVQRWALNSPLSIDQFYISDARIMSNLIRDTVQADLSNLATLVVQAGAD